MYTAYTKFSCSLWISNVCKGMGCFMLLVGEQGEKHNEEAFWYEADLQRSRDFGEASQYWKCVLQVLLCSSPTKWRVSETPLHSQYGPVNSPYCSCKCYKFAKLHRRSEISKSHTEFLEEVCFQLWSSYGMNTIRETTTVQPCSSWKPWKAFLTVWW